MNIAPSTSLAHMPDARVLPAVWKLLLLRVRITYNSFRHAPLRRKISIIVAILLILAFAGFLVTMSWFLLGFLRSPELIRFTKVDPQPFIEAIPALILTGLFLGILLTSFGVLLQAMYLSGDMDFLLASPVPIRAVFVAKLLQAVLPNFAFISLFGLPVLFGLGISGGYTLLYYPLVLLTMIVLALAAAGLSSLLVMLVVRVMPPRRAAEILGFVGAFIGLTLSQAGNLSNTFRRDIHVSGTQFTELLTRANTPWVPLNWAGQGLVALGKGNWLPGILLVSLTLGLASAAFGLALITAEHWYYTGWAGMQVIAHKKKAAKKTPRTEEAGARDRLTRLLGLLPTPVAGIIQKDFLTLRRDLRTLSQLISPLIFSVIYMLAMFRNTGDFSKEAADAPLWISNSLQIVLSYSSVGMSLFVGWMLLSRMAGMGFSHEGKNFWILKASPVRAGHLLAAKFLVAYLPTWAMGMIFLVITAVLQKLPFINILYSFVAISMCLAGMAGILLAFGALGANLTWDDPRKINSGGMGCLGQIITMLYLPLSFGLFIGPLGVVSLLGFPTVYGYLAGLALGISLNGMCAWLSLKLVEGRIAKLGEE
jgi:ABC-2 type transport system permease protein